MTIVPRRGDRPTRKPGRLIKKYKFLSGMFIWTGFDYLGEPTPYSWPARSSYFGIIDLCGFPKDAYYLYQSEWTDKPVLHIFPHWNWKPGDTIDVRAYANAQEVELFLNGVSLGARRKAGDDLHLQWRVPFAPGTIRAVSRSDGKTILTRRSERLPRPHGSFCRLTGQASMPTGRISVMLR